MTPPTNEPKMPEVIYADNNPEHPNLRHCYHRQMDGTTTYHHNDKVNELKEALRELLLYWNNPYIENKHKEAALTKASNLLK